MTRTHGTAATRTVLGATVVLTATGLLALGAAPAHAADPVAQAEAEAISLRVGGQSLTDQVGGPYRVTNDGDRETTSGTNRPRATFLGGQDDLQLGTLAQDATTTVTGGRGSSAACAGVAGDGASLAAVGDGGDFCLTPGETAQLTAGALDLDALADVSLVEGTPSLDDLLGQLPPPLDTLPDAYDDLNAGLNEALEPFGDAGLVVDVGAIQSRCTAGPGRVADGSARLTDVGVFLQLPEGTPDPPGERIDLVDLTPDPAPNTNVATDLDEVVDIVVGAFVDSLDQSDLPPELTGGLEEVREAVRDNLTSQLADRLGPLDQEVLSGTLNKQTRSPGAIEVTALDLQVLPAIADQVGFAAVDAQLGRSSCGPGGTVDRPTPTEPPATPPADPPAGGQVPATPAVPRSVPAGLADSGDGGLPPVLGLAALTALATATGVTVARRRSRA